MQPSDVTMYGRDYSAREFSDEEFRRYMRENPRERPVNFLGRYIGYPGNRKCISYYPGMYKHHLNAGRPSFLFHQIGYGDMEGGYNQGRAHAQVALNDARSQRVGWDGESHIVACMDRFYAKQGYRTLAAGDLREYMRGFRSVLGDRAGFYGFYDSMRDAIREGWASFYVQCGARSAHVPGIHCWQENNYQPTIFGTGTDILELYCDPAYAFEGAGMNVDDRIELVSPASRERGDNPLHVENPTLRTAMEHGYYFGTDAYRMAREQADLLESTRAELRGALDTIKVSEDRIAQIAKKAVGTDILDDTK